MSDTHDRSQNVPAPYAADAQLIPGEPYQYPDYSFAADAPEGTDWGRIGALLWQRKWWILAAVVLGTGIGYGATRFLVPTYQADTTVWIEQPDSRSGPIRPDELLQGEGWADVFNSRAVLEPVVRERKLYLKLQQPVGLDRSIFQFFELEPEFMPGTYTLSTRGDGSWMLTREGTGVIEKGEGGQPVGQAAGFRWDPPQEALRPGVDIRFRAITPQQAVVGLFGALTVKYNPNSYLIRATLTSPDPVEAAAVLNALADHFVRTATELKKQKIHQEVEMLEEQTRFTATRLASAEMALENHKIQTITQPTEPLASPPIATTFGQTPASGSTVRDPVFDAYFQKKLAADQLASDLQQLEEIRSTIVGGGEPNLMALELIPSTKSSPDLQAAIQQVRQAEIQRRTLLYTYTENYPQVRQLTGQIEDLKTRVIPSAIAAVASQVRNQLDVVSRRIDAQGAELKRIPTRTIEGARLQREMAMAEQLHNLLLVRLKEAQLAEATSGPGISVLDRAWPPSSPIGNSGPRIIALCAMASFGLGIGGVLLVDKLDKRIRRPDQVTSLLGLPVLGVVPRLEAAPSPTSPQAAIAIESFRGLRTQIAHANGSAGGVTLVTSPAPREGKSMVAANLAISNATAGYRTILVDVDTRRGRAQEMFGLERSPGLTEYLRGTVEFDGLCQKTEVENLALLARGSAAGFNADLLDSARMDELLSHLVEDYEVIVLDGPPLAAGADALMLGERSDKVLVVLRAGATKQDLARAKLEMLGNVQLPIVGAVLNAMPKSTPYYEYYVNYYYAEAELAS